MIEYISNLVYTYLLAYTSKHVYTSNICKGLKQIMQAM